MAAKTKPCLTDPPPPKRSLGLPTDTERWYLDCLRTWVTRHKEAPSIEQFSSYVERTACPTWNALDSLTTKGWVVRTARRRFIPIEFQDVIK
jgi:hypothetical protein